MKIRNRRRSVFLLILITFLPLALFSQENVKGDINEDSVRFIGVLGSHYRLSASDVKVPLTKIKQANILSLSKATAYDELNQTSCGGVKILKDEIVEKPGVYTVELGLDQDDQVTKDIKVTVYDDTVQTSSPSIPPISSSGSNTSSSQNPPGSSSSSATEQPKTVKVIKSGVWLPLTGETTGLYAISGVIILLLLVLIILGTAYRKKKK
ncbi:LPXTG cell wall anchor domain-containing protein [Lactovum odontotermitis]